MMSLRPRWFDQSLVALLTVTCIHLLLSCVVIFRVAQATGDTGTYFPYILLYIVHWTSASMVAYHMRSRLHAAARRALVAFNTTLAVIFVDYASAMFANEAIGAVRLSLALLASLLANPVAAHVWRRRPQPAIVVTHNDDNEPFETYFLEGYDQELSVTDVESAADTQSAMHSIDLLKKD